MNKKTIIPLHVGTLRVDKSGLTYGKDKGVKVEAPIFMYYIAGTKENIIVDTGPADPEWGTKYHNPLIREKQHSVQEALASVGLRPKDVKLVINTHLHWDHCYGNTLFPDAKFIVQRMELRYAAAPDPKDEVYYENKITVPPYIRMFNQFECVDGDTEIVKDVRVVSIPGHSPGMQGVAVNTNKGVYFLAADAVPTYENWELQIAPGIFSDYDQALASFEKIKGIADYVVPGHDPLVLKHKSFG